MPRFNKLLIFDLDETLIYATDGGVDRMPDFRAFDYLVYKRPGVDEFVEKCLEWFEVGIWTSSGDLYAQAVVDKLFGGASRLALVWSSLRCSRRYDRQGEGLVAYKDVKKLVRRGYHRERIIMVDDSPEKLGRNHGNGVIVKPYDGDADDNELHLLLEYLEILGAASNVRVVEKRLWRQEIMRRRAEIAAVEPELGQDRVC
jgi:carboxy-terminal domain RNA polymerase II polypeptide A small phosphatase